METITEKTIDIEKILQEKMGKKARWVPRFAVNYLRRIAHEDRVNEFLWQSRDLKGTPWLEACLDFLETKVEVEGMENLPAKDDRRRYTFVSNQFIIFIFNSFTFINWNQIGVIIIIWIHDFSDRMHFQPTQ